MNTLKVIVESYKKTPLEVVVALTIMLFGTIFAVIVPPLWGLDEVAHFNRAFEVSNGVVRPVVNDEGRIGSDVPKNLAELEYTVYVDLMDNDTSAISKRHDRTPSIDYERILQQRPSKQLQPAFITSTYSPIAYIGATIGIGVVKAFDGTIGQMILLARMVNLTLYVICIYFSLYILRKQKIRWLIIVLTLIPVALFQASVVSADTLTNGIAMLLFASLLHIGINKKSVEDDNQLYLWIICIAIILLPLVKVNNIIFILVLPLLFMNKLIRSKKLATITTVVTGVLTILLACLWMKQMPTTDPSATPTPRIDGLAVSPPEQIHYMLTHPLNFAVTIIRSFHDSWDSYIKTFTVDIGWNSATLPIVYSIAMLLFVLCVIIYAKREIIGAKSIIIIYLATVGVLGILSAFAAMYVAFSTVGQSVVEGIQGRYFIPFIPFIILPLAYLLKNVYFVRWREDSSNRIFISMVVILAISVLNYLYILY